MYVTPYGTSVQYLVNTNDTCSWPAGAALFSIVVGTATATSVVTVYNGSSTSGEVKAVIDAASLGSYDFSGARFPNGLFVKMTTAAAKVSVVAC